MQVIKKKHNDLILLNINLTASISKRCYKLSQMVMSMNREENKIGPAKKLELIFTCTSVRLLI